MKKQKLFNEQCLKCGVIHDVEKAGGHDLLEAEKVALCECEDFPDDEYCQQLLKAHNEAEQLPEQPASDGSIAV